jgi:tricorn protease
LNKQGAVIDERFNGDGHVADYIIEAMQRRIVGYWAYRYGAVQTTSNASIPGPKVMIINEVADSGGDAMPWLFHQEKVGTLVGKRTWGGLVGIGANSGADGWWSRYFAELRIFLTRGQVAD